MAQNLSIKSTGENKYPELSENPQEVPNLPQQEVDSPELLQPPEVQGDSELEEPGACEACQQN
jgi:hypothetical protein